MRRSPLLVVFFTVFLDLLGFGIVLPVAPYFAKEYFTPEVAAWLRGVGGNFALGDVVGLLGSLYSLMQFFFAPIWGRLSDRVGRRPIILLSVFGSFLSYLIFALAHSIVPLLLSRMVAGVMAANISTAQAYVADVTGPEERARGMGMVGAALGLGFVFGPAVGWLVSGLGPRAPIYLAAGLALLNFLLALAILPESHRSRSVSGPARPLFRGGAMWDALRDPRLSALVQVFFLSTLAFAAMEGTLTLFLIEKFGMKEKDTYQLFAYVGIVVAFVQGGLLRRLAKRENEPRLIMVGTLSMAVGLALMARAPSVGALMGVLALLAFGSGISTPSVNSLASKLAGTEEHGATLGITQGFSSLGRALGPYFGGRLFSYGMGYPFLVGGALMLVAFLISLRLLSRKPGRVG
jgi:multidrug resistance protein